MEFKLSAEDMKHIQSSVNDLRGIVKQFEEARQFKVGDYIICLQINKDTQQKVPMKNSYGATQKWQIVFVDELGLPHAKSVIGVSGRPGGKVRSLVWIYGDDEWLIDGYDDYSFELDPDYVDSIILESDQYNPMEKHNELKSARQQIIEHNKKIKMPTATIDQVVDTFSKLEVGTTYWTSAKKGFTVLENNPHVLRSKVVLVKDKKIRYGKHHTVVCKIKVRHSNGRIEIYEPADMKNKNIYAGVPRSYNDPSDSI